MFKNDTIHWTGTGSINSPAERGPKSLKRGLPASIKDERYWEKRKKNNISAKRSREKSKQVEMLVKKRYISLENENAFLRRELRNIKLKYGIPFSEVFLNDKEREECSKEASAALLKVLGNSGKQSDFDLLKDVDTIGGDDDELTRPVCQTPPDTTTSPAHVNQVIDEQSDTSPKHQEYLWNRSPGASSTQQYTFYRPIEEDANSMVNSPTDLSMNRKSKLTSPDISSKHSGKSIKECYPETTKRLATNKDRTKLNSTLNGEHFVLETCNGSPAKCKSRHSEEQHHQISDNETVLDLTKDDDGDDNDDENENLSLKLQKLSDQIEVMQRLVHTKVGAKQDSTG